MDPGLTGRAGGKGRRIVPRPQGVSHEHTLAIVIAIAVVVLIVLGWIAYRATPRRRLRSRFGPEYERTVDDRGSVRRAERDLLERAEARDQLQLHELDRGYPVENFEQQADLVSVDHPRVVEHHRVAHTIAERSGRGDPVSPEDRPNAFVHHRQLFDQLLNADGDESRHRDDDRDRDDVPSEHRASARSDDGRR